MNILGIDIGWGTTKTSNDGQTSQIVTSAIVVADDIKLLGNDLDVIENIDGTFIIGRGATQNDTFKYNNRNFINLLHYTIVKNTNEKEVNIVCSIPASQYNNFRVEMKNQIMKNNYINLKLNGAHKAVKILDATITPEGYGIFKTMEHLIIKSQITNVIDGGHGTTDVCHFNSLNKFEDGVSVNYSLKDFYDMVRTDLYYQFPNLTNEDIRDVVRGVLTLPNLNTEIIDNCKARFYYTWLDKIKGVCQNLLYGNIILSGGIAPIIGDLMKKDYPSLLINERIDLNAVSNYYIGVSKYEGSKQNT